MKKPLILNILRFLILFFTFTNCSKHNESELKIDKSRISNIEKLTSPNKKFDAYLFSIENGMSFGSAINVLKIIKHNEEPNFSNSDFFKVPDSRPFKIEWKNDNELVINTISNNKNFENKQPLKTEIQSYKGFKIENNTFTMFSSIAMTEFKFSKYYEKNENIIFKNENDSLVFNKENSQFSIATGYIEINYFERNKYDKNKGLAFNAYKLIPEYDFDLRKFDKFQPLINIEK